MTYRRFLNIGLILSVSTFFVSCAQDGTEAETLSSDAAVEEPSTTAVPDVITPQPTTTLTQDPVTASGPLNPAHGEPGHRCEIPVGAPLNSAPAGASTTISPNLAPSTSPVAAPAMGSGKLNPPHGEPGHDCAVPVGSPLPG